MGPPGSASLAGYLSAFAEQLFDCQGFLPSVEPVTS